MFSIYYGQVSVGLHVIN